MKTHGTKAWALALFVLLAAPFAVAQTDGSESEVTLKVGDAAPALEVTEWVKGEPVKLADGKGEKVYVVEFWATWCPPCRRSIPHLTELQRKYKDRGVVIVGVTMEDPGEVKPFVEDMGAKMDYTVAVDGEQKAANAYMMAAGVQGIPHAFVIDKEGKIAWHGHPMDEAFEAKLEELAPAPAEDAQAKAAFQPIVETKIEKQGAAAE